MKKYFLILILLTTACVASAQTKPSFLQLKDTPGADIRAYGAISGDGEDDTAAIHAALASNSHIIIPNGTFHYSTLNIPVSATISGEGMFTAYLIAEDASSIIILPTTGSTHISGLTIFGSAWETGTYATGSVGISTRSNLTMTNVNIRYFANGIYWSGGYYHKYINCAFLYCGIALNNINANNFTLIGCRVAAVTSLAYIAGGVGNFTFTHGSFEGWTGLGIYTSEFNEATITFSDNYVESFVDSKEHRPTIIKYGNGLLNFERNLIFTPGIYRGIHCYFATDIARGALRSIGNIWQMPPASLNDTQYLIYKEGSRPITLLEVRDSVNTDISTGSIQVPIVASYPIVGLSQEVFDYAGVFSGNDPVSKRPIVSKLDITPLTGWALTTTEPLQLITRNDVSMLTGRISQSGTPSARVCEVPFFPQDDIAFFNRMTAIDVLGAPHMFRFDWTATQTFLLYDSPLASGSAGITLNLSWVR